MPSRKTEYGISVVVLHDTIKLNSNFAGSKSRKQHVQTSRGLVKNSKYISVLRSLFSSDVIKINQKSSCKTSKTYRCFWEIPSNSINNVLAKTTTKSSLFLGNIISFYKQWPCKNSAGQQPSCSNKKKNLCFQEMPSISTEHFLATSA